MIPTIIILVLLVELILSPRIRETNDHILLWFGFGSRRKYIILWWK